LVIDLRSSFGIHGMATLHEIAKEAGVSVNTVSRVLNGKIKANYPAVARKADAVRRIAAKHGYRPNAAARAMVSRRTRQIGVLVPNNPGNRFTHPLAYETILGINEGLQKAGYVMSLARIDDVRGDLAKQSRVFEETVLDGMIALDSLPPEVEERLETLIPAVVWCDSNVWREHGCIRRDEKQAGRLAGNAAAKAGYTRILMMTYAPEHRVHFSATERFEGVSDAVAEASHRLEVIVEPGLNKPREREALAAALRPDTVVICNSIYQAHALRSVAEEAGKTSGRDFGMVCCDDQHQLDRMWPGLARVSYDRYALGLEAASLMTHLLERGQPVPSKKLNCEWIPGSTLLRGGDGTISDSFPMNP
jgi:LacI family transcriptional regulator